MNKFNYILNDLALSNLITRCLYSENASCSDKEELENQIKLIQQENEQLKIQISAREEVCNRLEGNWNKLKKDLELVVDYGLGDESSKWDKIYGEYAKSTLKFMQELQGSDSND